jgi:hypothetical protein
MSSLNMKMPKGTEYKSAGKPGALQTLARLRMCLGHQGCAVARQTIVLINFLSGLSINGFSRRALWSSHERIFTIFAEVFREDFCVARVGFGGRAILIGGRRSLVCLSDESTGSNEVRR